MTTQRRASSLTKAPESRNLVDQLVAHSAPTAELALSQPATPRAPDSVTTVERDLLTSDAPQPAPRRRGPGRPRNNRVMRPLTTTIEIGLRERVDAYASENNATLVDVLDQALRLALDTWQGEDGELASEHRGTCG